MFLPLFCLPLSRSGINDLFWVSYDRTNVRFNTLLKRLVTTLYQEQARNTNEEMMVTIGMWMIPGEEEECDNDNRDGNKKKKSIRVYNYVCVSRLVSS